MGRFVEEENGDAVREAKVLHASILCNGDETQKLWKPLLTQFSLSEAYRNGLDKGIRWDIFFSSCVPSEPAPFRLPPNKTYAIPQRCDKISLDYDKTEEFSYDI